MCFPGAWLEQTTGVAFQANKKQAIQLVSYHVLVICQAIRSGPSWWSKLWLGFNKLKTTPTPNKNGLYGIKGAGVVCQMCGSVGHIFCRAPSILRDIYARRTPIVRHILGSCFLQIWGVGGGQSCFHCCQHGLPGLKMNKIFAKQMWTLLDLRGLVDPGDSCWAGLLASSSEDPPGWIQSAKFEQFNALPYGWVVRNARVTPTPPTYRATNEQESGQTMTPNASKQGKLDNVGGNLLVHVLDLYVGAGVSKWFPRLFMWTCIRQEKGT